MSNRVYKGKIEKLRSHERIQMLEISRVVDLSIQDIQVKSVLDVGTGSAVFAQAFAERNLAVTGIDINQNMLSEAQRHVPSGIFSIGKAESLPFPDNEFDIVFLGHILHETADIEKALEEAKRVTRHRVIILEWPYSEDKQGPPLSHRLKAEEIIKAAEKTGFNDIEEISLKHMVLYRIQ
ncbi:MAG: methyltransferase domain-containing protein [Spirochaetes bacterium]|nr:methyltransferase domain-containing protein [Spirochaetota bacterium]